MSSQSLVYPQADWVVVNVEFDPSFVPPSSWKEYPEWPKQGDVLRRSSVEILRTGTSLKMLSDRPEEPEEISPSLLTHVDGNIGLSNGKKGTKEAKSKGLPPHVSNVEVEVIHVSNRHMGTPKIRSNDQRRHISKETAKEHECFCRVCCRGGPFMKCHTCTAVYHKNCLCEAAWKRTAEDTWRCPNCIYMNGKDAMRPDDLKVEGRQRSSSNKTRASI